MGGLGINVDVYADPNIYPYFGVDPILTDDGSLVLVDFAHSANPLIGVPASGTVVGGIPNIAWEEASKLAGVGTQSEWAMTSFLSLTSADGFIERSGKGGVHVCMSQVNGTGTSKGFAVRRQTTDPGRLLAYLYANRTHNYYMSKWERITRPALTAVLELTEAQIYAASATDPYNTGLLNMPRNSIVNAGLGSAAYPILPQTTGPAFRAGGFPGFTSSGAPSSAADIVAALMAVGQNPAAYGGVSLINKSRSTILYRAYLEDLTTSGRTFAEVQAIDRALFDQAFAVGGRYYNDTFTDLI